MEGSWSCMVDVRAGNPPPKLQKQQGDVRRTGIWNLVTGDSYNNTSNTCSVVLAFPRGSKHNRINQQLHQREIHHHRHNEKNDPIPCFYDLSGDFRAPWKNVHSDIAVASLFSCGSDQCMILRTALFDDPIFRKLHPDELQERKLTFRDVFFSDDVKIPTQSTKSTN